MDFICQFLVEFESGGDLTLNKCRELFLERTVLIEHEARRIQKDALKLLNNLRCVNLEHAIQNLGVILLLYCTLGSSSHMRIELGDYQRVLLAAKRAQCLGGAANQAMRALSELIDRGAFVLIAGQSQAELSCPDGKIVLDKPLVGYTVAEEFAPVRVPTRVAGRPGVSAKRPSVTVEEAACRIEEGRGESAAPLAALLRARELQVAGTKDAEPRRRKGTAAVNKMLVRLEKATAALLGTGEEEEEMVHLFVEEEEEEEDVAPIPTRKERGRRRKVSSSDDQAQASSPSVDPPRGMAALEALEAALEAHGAASKAHNFSFSKANDDSGLRHSSSKKCRNR